MKNRAPLDYSDYKNRVVGSRVDGKGFRGKVTCSPGDNQQIDGFTYEWPVVRSNEQEALADAEALLTQLEQTHGYAFGVVQEAVRSNSTHINFTLYNNGHGRQGTISIVALLKMGGMCRYKIIDIFEIFRNEIAATAKNRSQDTPLDDVIKLDVGDF